MKRYRKYLILGTLVLLGSSCSKYLNVTPDDVGTIDYAFRNRNEAENYLFTCYATLQQFSDQTCNGAFTTSSEIIYPNNLSATFINETGFDLVRGTQIVSSPGLDFWDGQNGGQITFAAIRRCNTMLENINQPVDLGAAEKKRWIAEVKFLKAYYHFYLFRMYGPIPIIDQNSAINASTDDVRVKRAPVDDVVNYIVSLLDAAAPDLPTVITNVAKEYGRITQPIALSVKAEVLAMAASPLYNGNPDYVSFKDKAGKNLFSTTADPLKWKKAADAALASIQLCESLGMHLYTYTPPATITNLSDSLKKELSIQNAVTEKWDINPELIWALNPAFNLQGFVIPRLTSNSIVNSSANPSNFAVPIAEQELFYTDKGVPITEDKTWDYTNRYTLQAGDAASRFFIKNGYTTVKAHFARETRFYADISFDGAIWFGNGILDQNNPYYVSARGNSSTAGPKDNYRLNISGYWPKKLANYLSVYDNGFQAVDYRLPLIRLAGMYLLYAEALNEVNGPTADVLTYVDKVRTRANLPGVKAAWTNYSNNPTKFSTKEGMRQIIHQERRIELAFEAQSGWDLRRWKELQGVLSTPLQGWSIYESQAINYYRPRTLIDPVFNLKDYLWPIKADDLVLNPNLVQNPYY